MKPLAPVTSTGCRAVVSILIRAYKCSVGSGVVERHPAGLEPATLGSEQRFPEVIAPMWDYSVLFEENREFQLADESLSS